MIYCFCSSGWLLAGGEINAKKSNKRLKFDQKLYLIFTPFGSSEKYFPRVLKCANFTTWSPRVLSKATTYANLGEFCCKFVGKYFLINQLDIRKE